jgi:hypothetical protein
MLEQFAKALIVLAAGLIALSFLMARPNRHKW